MLLGPFPSWARFAAASVIALAIVWVLAGQTLIRNRRKLNALWCSKALAIIACVVALTGFFSRIFGSALKPFHGYDLFGPDQATMVGYMTLAVIGTVLVLALVARASPTGLLVSALQALLGVLGGVIWIPMILRFGQNLAYGTYLLEVGFACVAVASLWQFKEVADRMPAPREPASVGRDEDRPTL